MPLRDLALTLIIAIGLIKAFTQPAIGALLYSWVSMMNPHKMTYGFAFSFPWAQVIAIVTLLGLLLSKQRKELPINAATVSLLLLLTWVTATSAASFIPSDLVWERWLFVMKIHVMVLATIMLVRGRRHIDFLVWVMVFAIGFFGVKGGLFTIAKGGVSRVWGPPGGMLEDNNYLAVGLLMILPLMYYVAMTVPKRWMRYGMYIAMVLVGVSVLGSQSRGAFLGLACMAVFLGLKSRHPVRMLLLLSLLLVVGIAFMPESWTARMDTIQGYQADTSAMSRIYTWMTLWNVASDRPFFGAGFRAEWIGVFERYAPTDPQFAIFKGSVWVAHSIYFQALGEHGFPGLILYLTIWFSTWVMASSTAKRAEAASELAAWAPLLMRMCQVSLVGFLVGGAFLSLMNLDVPFYLMAIVVVTRQAVVDDLSHRRPVPMASGAGLATGPRPLSAGRG